MPTEDTTGGGLTGPPPPHTIRTAPRMDAVHYSLAFGWVTASTAGAVIGWWLLTSIVQRLIPLDFLFSQIGLVVTRGLVIGAALGLFQQRTLLQMRAGIDRWVVRTMLAYLVGSGFLAGISFLPKPPLTLVSGNFLDACWLTLAGCLMGALQATGFRGRQVDRRWWVLMMGISWAVGAALPALVPGLGGFTYVPNAVAQALWGVGVGLLTLYPLWGLIRSA